MTNINDITYIGVDIAKLKFDVCLHNGNFSNCVYESYSNDFDGFFNFFSFLESANLLQNIRLGLEATSTYMVNLQKYLDSHSIKYILINPSKLHHYIKYKNFESKTDKLDSYYIADYLTTLDDKLFNSSHSGTKTLYKSYSGYINLVIKAETHLKGLNDSILNDDFTSLTLKNEIIALKLAFTKTKNVALKELITTIKISMPEYDLVKNDLIGVSDKTLLAVLPIIYDISQTSSLKQLQSLIGLNPVYKDSGTSVHKKQHISKSGNHEVRKMLYMSAVGSVRTNTEIKIKYDRLLANGKPTKVALIAISAHIFRAIITKLNYYKSLNQ
ncbi:MAG: transposase [Sulfurimonas sp.]|nr:transposase [Sulfurimonas sp.]